MNIIFLDIDGVLNSIDSMLASPEKPHKREEELDEVSINLLKRLCRLTDAKIVISSTWRELYTIEEFKSIFASYGWENFPIIGVTTSDNVCPTSNYRGYEIQHWLNNNNLWANYLILDDDSDMLEEQSEQFIHVSNIHGFRTTHYCKALRIFGKPDEQLESQVNWRRHESN